MESDTSKPDTAPLLVILVSVAPAPVKAPVKLKVLLAVTAPPTVRVVVIVPLVVANRDEAVSAPVEASVFVEMPAAAV